MLTGILFGLASASLWAMTSLAAKAQSERVDPILFNIFRLTLGSALFIALLPFFGGWEAIAILSTSSRWALAVSIVCGGVMGDSLFFWSMTKIGAARAMPISGTYPLFTWAFAVPMLNEPVTLNAIIGTAVVLAGVFLLTPPAENKIKDEDHLDRMGVITALLAAVLWAFSTTLMKIGLEDPVNVVAVNSFRLPIGALVLAIFVWQWRRHKVRASFTRKNLPALFLVSIVSVGLGSVLWIFSVEYAGAARAALINAMAPLIGAPLAVIFLREKMTWKIALGTLFAVIGVWLVL